MLMRRLRRRAISRFEIEARRVRACRMLCSTLRTLLALTCANALTLNANAPMRLAVRTTRPTMQMPFPKLPDFGGGDDEEGNKPAGTEGDRPVSAENTSGDQLPGFFSKENTADVKVPFQLVLFGGISGVLLLALLITLVVT